MQPHHVVSKQALKRRHLYKLLWDVRNGVCLCERCHRRHEARIAPVPYELLPPQCIEFAQQINLLWLLEQRYPKKQETAS